MNEEDQIRSDEEVELEVEGLGDVADASWGDYPIDTVRIRTESRTVHDVLRRIDKGSFIMDPDFQRDFIWSEDKQSKLIESVLMRIPLPVFYLAEDEQGKMIVVDGLQRLSTFKRFADTRLKLKLPDQEELNGKTFIDLSAKLQNRIEDCNLVLYVIDAKVPERARLDIFERVNGGVPLTRQQMRNCLYMGDATKLLKEEANTELFLRATGNSLRSKTMRDREFVNRFCAFQLIPAEEYPGDMDVFLATALKLMNEMTPQALEKLAQEFRTCLRNNYAVFKSHAFRKHTKQDQSRSVINASIWDVMTTGLSRYSEERVESQKARLQSMFYELMDDEEFTKNVTYATSDTKRVISRLERAHSAISEVLNDSRNHIKIFGPTLNRVGEV